jgi:hypothetical protein
MNNQDALDPRLQQLYRQLPKEQPSPELDEKILAAAGVGVKKRLSWYLPFSMAASVVMVSSLVLYLAKQPETLEQATAVTSLPKRVTEKEMATSAPMSEDFIDQRENVSAATAESGSSHYVTPESLKPSAPTLKRKSNSSVAVEDQPLQTLKDIKVEVDQNRVANESVAIKEEVANVASSPQPAIAKQDHLDGQTSDNLSSINQSVIADRVIQEQRALATARMSESVGAVAKMQAEKKVMAERHEEKAKLAVMKPTALTIEGVGLGMNREQLHAQGFSCEANTCSQTLSHPQQVSYWGVASQNAQINAVLSNNIVTRLALHQNIATPKLVEKSLLAVGIASQKICADEKGEWLLSRQLETTIIQLNTMRDGVVLTICQ